MARSPSWASSICLEMIFCKDFMALATAVVHSIKSCQIPTEKHSSECHPQRHHDVSKQVLGQFQSSMMNAVLEVSWGAM